MLPALDDATLNPQLEYVYTKEIYKIGLLRRLEPAPLQTIAEKAHFYC